MHSYIFVVYCAARDWAQTTLICTHAAVQCGNTTLAMRVNSMAVHGSVGQFYNAGEDWMSYCEQLVEYFTANDIKLEENGMLSCSVFTELPPTNSYAAW